MSTVQHKGWYKWGNLPHYDVGGLYQSITYRLDDSLPQAKLSELEEELRLMHLSELQMKNARRKQIEAWLDAGYGSCILREPNNAQLMIETWQYFAGERYDLIAWVVMPNHVHVLIHVYEGAVLERIVTSWKNFTSRRFVASPEVERIPHWQAGFWDRFIRNEAHFRNAVVYIEHNPVTAGLVKRPEQWVFGSAYARYVGDGTS